MNKQEIIKFYLDHDILISPELLNSLESIPLPINSDFIVQNNDSQVLLENNIPINIGDYERAVVLKEKHHNSRLYDKFFEYIYSHTVSKENFSKKNEKELLNPKNLSLNNISTNSSSSFQPAITADENPKEIYVPITKKTIDSDFVDGRVSNDLRGSLDTVDEYGNNISLEKDSAEKPPTIPEDKLELYKEEYMKLHNIKIVHDYKEKSKKRSVQDFVGFFNSRFKDIERILRTRQELQNLTSIGRIIAKKEKENVALIGMVYDKQVSKNNNLILTLEDPTGFVRVIVTQSKEDLFTLASEIQLDEMIGVTGTFDKFIFANNILLPDIPLTKELKKSPEEGYFVVITDTQFGNKLFLDNEFKKFLQWIKGEAGSEAQREIASKVKYLFIAGDIVEGVGIYPDQEYDLRIVDVKDQYKEFAKYLTEIKHIPIIVCPGNHDVGRLSEPQPSFKDDYSKALWTIPNVICVSNPSIVNIFSSDQFEGFDVLLYHGGSFFYYFNNVPAIRQKGGVTRSDLVMKYLLQRRHLAPSHTSTVYIPDSKKDPLVIDRVPDFFFSGHVHRATVNNYRNVTCINASCWVSKSEEQERRGLDPQPGRAFAINIQTREVKVMNFLSKEEESKETKAPSEKENLATGGHNG